VKGTAVGFMSVCSTVDVELLSSCFDIKPFNGLQKLRGLTPPRGTFTSVNDLLYFNRVLTRSSLIMEGLQFQKEVALTLGLSI